MAFRIDRGVFKFYDANRADYISKFKIDEDSGQIVELDEAGNITDGYLTTSSKAADSNLLDGIDSSAFLRSNTADTFTGTLTMGTQVALVANNYGRGVFGTYSATRYQHLWGMGSAYKLADDGTSTGNFYGVAWTHQNIGGESVSGLGHQMLIMSNGDTRTAIGDGIWTKYDITTTAAANAADFNGTNFRVGNAVYFGGGNNYLNWTNSKVYSNVGIQSAGGFYDELGNQAATYRHSGSDFADGTLVTTNIPATATSGASFIIEVIGKSYSSNPPFKFIAQGYLYNGTIINYSGQHFGYAGFSQLKVFKHTDGNLAFWWQRVSYWNSFEVRVIDAGGSSENRVVGIANSREIDSDKKVTITMKASATEDWVDSNFLRTGEKAVDSAKADVARDLGSTYTADTWFRATSDNKTVKFYGNSRMMVFRTDGEGGDTGHTGYAFKWTYGGDGTSNTRMLLDNNGNLWTSSYGWLHSKFDTAGTASTLVDAAKEELLNGAISTAQTTADNAATAAASATTTANTAVDRADGTKAALTELTNSLGTAAYTASTAYAAASHSHSYLPLSGGTVTGALTVSGSTTRGTYTSASQYHSGADNIVLKGNASGISSIFFESEKDGTNINHPSDFGFIQYHAYGTSTSGEANELIIGVSNDADDHVILNAPNVNGLKFRTGVSATDYTVWHAGNFDPATKESAGAAADVLAELDPRISTAQTTADNAATAAATAQTTATTAETRANETKQAVADLGNSLGTAAYAATGDFLGATAKAADANLLDGIDSSRFVFGGNATKTTNVSNFTTALSSGFYDAYNTTGTPTGTWYTMINMRHNNTGNNYGSQIAVSFYSNADMFVRTISNGSYQGWSRIWNEANFDPNSKASTSSVSTAQTTADEARDLAIAAQTTADGKLGKADKAADADKLDGYDWMQSGKSVRANEFYADNWFRNYNSNEGLYNEATGQHWYSDGDDYWNIAGGTSFNAIRFRDEHGGTQRGLVGADNINRIGFLDAGGSWAVLHTNDVGTNFYTDNETLEFRVGRDAVSGDYGTVQVDTTRNSWAGYSIQGNYVFMSSSTTGCGIYNDVDNEWMAYFKRNDAAQLFFNGVKKLETTNTGVAITGTISATTFSGTATYAESAGSVAWSGVTGKPTIAEPIPFTDETRGTSSNIASMRFDGRYIVITLENGASFGMAGNPM